MFNLNSKIRVWCLRFKMLKCHEIKHPRLLKISRFGDSHHMPSAHTHKRSYRKAKEAILQQARFLAVFYLCNKNL